MVTAAIRSQLLHLVLEVPHPVVSEVPFHAFREGPDGIVVTHMGGILTTKRPFRRNSQRLTYGCTGSFRHRLKSEGTADLTRLLRRALPLARAGRSAFHDGVDQGPANLTVDDVFLRQVQLEQAHGTLDIHAHRARIDVGRRDHDTTNRRAITGVGIGIQHHISDARSHPAIQRLLQAVGIETGTDGLRADHSDRLTCRVRQRDKTFGKASGMDSRWVHKNQEKNQEHRRPACKFLT